VSQSSAPSPDARAPIVLGITTAGRVEAAVSVSAERPAAIAAVAAEGPALASLLDCITQVLADTDIALSDVGAVAVCTGPGSFTGLRIGVAFAKSLAQARDLPCIGVSSYDIAEAGSRALYPRASIVEGKRGYFYARLRSAPGAEPLFVRGETREIETEIERFAAESSRPVALHGACEAVTGSRAAIQAARFSSRGPGELARAVVRLGVARLREGTDTDWRRIAIDYGQRPNAVINWETGSKGRG
jgi:tRNA threonylcarbamoyladenosine biosynthesis protein TsaB